MKNFFIPLLRKTILLATLMASLTVLSAQDIDKNKQITLPPGSTTRSAVIEQIQRQTDYRVAYDRKVFNDKASVQVERTTTTLGDVLSRMLDDTEYTYAVDGKYIILHHRNDFADNSQVIVTAVRTVSGTVIDSETGAAQENVLIEFVDVAGATARTNVMGRFTVAEIPAGNQIVKLTPADGGVVRYREIRVPAASDPDVTLPLGDEIVLTNQHKQQPKTETRPDTRTTAYFVPNGADHTIRAFSDEPKTNYSFIPYSDINNTYLPRVGVKTNLLYLATTTPNLAVEFGLARKWTLDLAAAYNPFQLQKGGINLMWFVQPEARYWFCQRFEKHFIGLHGLYGRFNIGDVDFLTTTFEEHRYKGWGAGAGISYGYHLPLAKRWAMEFTLGVGYVYLEYDKYRCYDCDEFVAKKNRHYFGPTKAGISLIFMIK